MIHTGGYQTGRSYTWYRAMGHSRPMARFMVWSNRLWWPMILLLAAMVGFLFGAVLDIKF